MACIDFGSTSFCSQVSNILTVVGNPQSFLTYQIAGYNHPAFGGCQWFTSKVASWSNTLANANGMGQRRQLTAKIDWANCMLSACCPAFVGTANYGCMDDGTRGNDYLNNQGTSANPQYGSVLPLDAQGNPQPAFNYYGGATQDDGSCFYVQPIHGCKDPAANNYNPNADMDCGNSYVSEFNINYTNWQGIQPPGTWTPYGDESCCTYDPPSTGIDYDYRFVWHNTYGYPGKGRIQFIDTKEPGIGSNWISAAAGLNKLHVKVASHDIRANPVFVYPISCINQGVPYIPPIVSSWPTYVAQFSNSIWNLKIYTQTEVLMGDWDYELTDLPQACGVSYCDQNMQFDLVTKNYENPIYQLTEPISGLTYISLDGQDGPFWTGSSAPNYWNPTSYWPNGGIVPSAYVALTSDNIPLLNTYTRGNTANLMNHLGSGNNMRDFGGNTVDYHNWPWICDKCPPCELNMLGNVNVGPALYMLEVPPVNYPNNGDFMNLYPNMTAVVNSSNSPCGSGWINPSGWSSKLGNTSCGGNFIAVKSSFIENDAEVVTIKNHEDENDLLKDYEITGSIIDDENYIITKHTGRVRDNGNIFNITFKTKDGYYYSKSPSLTMNFPGMENYKIKVESEIKSASGYVTEKTFNVNYKNTGFDVFEEDGHNIIFTTKIAKEVDESTETQVKEITALRIGTVKNLKSKGNGNIKY